MPGNRGGVGATGSVSWMLVETHLLAAAVAGGLGFLLLVWLVIAGLVGRRRAFPHGLEAAPRASEPGATGRFFPDPRYFFGLWCIFFGLGAIAGFGSAFVLGIAGAIVLVLGWGRAGVQITGDELVLGTFQQSRIGLGELGVVQLAPRGAVGKQFGVFGVTDMRGDWVAALRYNTVVRGPYAAALIINRTDMQPGDKRMLWKREDSELPFRAVPFVGV